MTSPPRPAEASASLRARLGIDLPIIQAPMAGSQDSTLAAAVSNSGALGSLPCALLTPQGMRDELAKLRAATERPFNVNFFCHAPPTFSAEREAGWRSTLAPYYREFGLNPDSIPAGPGRAPFNEEAAELLSEYCPRVVSFHFGLPSLALLERVRAIGAAILSTATTIDEAMWLEGNGIDGIIAQGIEAGGHRGSFLTDDLTTQRSTHALVSQLVRVVRLPIIAAGGIANAADVSALLQRGAAAVQVGTAYLLCPEATTTPVHRTALRSDSLGRTVLTNVFTGRPARGIVNRLIREVGPMSPVVPAFPLATSAVLPLRAAAERTGSGDFSPLWAGEKASEARELPAGQVTRMLVEAI
jgi:nitronate monooxygenase